MSAYKIHRKNEDGTLEEVILQGAGGGSGSTEPFIVTFTNGGNNNYTVDVTYDDIEEAFSNGKIVIGKDATDSYIYQIFGLCDDDTIPFSRIVAWSENGADIETLFVNTDDSVSCVRNTLSTTALATATTKGLMSAADKKKLDGISAGGTGGGINYNKVQVDYDAVNEIEYDDDTIYWDTDLIFSQNQGQGDEEVDRKAINVQLPLLAGNGIEFTPNSDRTRLYINATGGGGSGDGQPLYRHDIKIEDAINDSYCIGLTILSNEREPYDTFDKIKSKVGVGNHISASGGVGGSQDPVYSLYFDESEFTIWYSPVMNYTLNYTEVDMFVEDTVTQIGIVSGGGVTTLQQSITHAKLKLLRDNGKLVAGMQYRITDFVTTTNQPDTRSAGHQFDIIVTALSANSLSENASADHHITGGVGEGCTFKDEVIADEDGNLNDGAVTSYYYIYEDFSGPGEGPLAEGYKSMDIFVEYDYLGNNDGVTVPVLYKNDLEGYGEEGPDYQDVFYYEGNIKIDGITYDKWRKICDSQEGGPFWDASTGKIWALTNVIVNAGDSADDDYFKYANLGAWEIKYCLDNDETRFVWADEENGKGVIYYMKDEFNNECSYDFKNIQFIRQLDEDGNLDLENGSDTWCYTFGGNQWDRSIPQEEVKIFNHNSICPYYTGCDGAFSLPNNVFLGNSECMTKNNKLAWLCTDNTFATECQNNTLGFNSSNNIFGYSCKNNIFGNDCNDNKLGDSVQNVTFETGCINNIIPSNTYCSKFENNVIWIMLVSDTEYGNVQYVTIARGISGDGVNHKVIQARAGAYYEQIFRKSGSQEILID